jgi:response regulator RpfG family c-di-GMP phosphodiesterase
MAIKDKEENSENETKEETAAGPETETAAETAAEELQNSGNEEQQPESKEEKKIPDIPVSENIKMLNFMLQTCDLKPLFYDKMIKKGFIAVSLMAKLGILKFAGKPAEGVVSAFLPRIGMVLIQEDDRARTENLIIAAYLSDIGMIGIAESISLKASRLLPEEREIIKEHPLISARKSLQITDGAYKYIIDHHELPIGKGYFGKITDISKESLIIGIADTFIGMGHMMRSTYKASSSPVEAAKAAVKPFRETSGNFTKEEIDYMEAALSMTLI